MGRYLQEAFQSSNIPVEFLEELQHSQPASPNGLRIPITDSLSSANMLIKSAAETLISGIVLLEYEFPEQLQKSSIVETIRKPIKFYNVIQGIISLLIQRFASREQEPLRLETTMAEEKNVPEHQLKILVAEDDLLNQEVDS